MKRISIHTLDYYNKCVIPRIAEKYHMNMMNAIRAFLLSKTHAMLENPEMALWEFPEWAIFEIWETEHNTGNPRDSMYLKGE